MLSAEIPSTVSIDVNGLEMSLKDRQKDFPQVSRSGISPVIPDPDLDGSGNVNLQGMIQIIFSLVSSNIYKNLISLCRIKQHPK